MKITAYSHCFQFILWWQVYHESYCLDVLFECGRTRGLERTCCTCFGPGAGVVLFVCFPFLCLFLIFEVSSSLFTQAFGCVANFFWGSRYANIIWCDVKWRLRNISPTWLGRCLFKEIRWLTLGALPTTESLDGHEHTQCAELQKLWPI